MKEETKAEVKQMVATMLELDGKPLIPNSLLDVMINESMELKVNMKHLDGSDWDPSDETDRIALGYGIVIGVKMMIALVKAQLPLKGDTLTLNYGGFAFEFYEGCGPILEVIGTAGNGHQ
jgi:hypothetical protein